MKHRLLGPIVLGVLGFLLPAALFFVEEHGAYNYALAHQGEKLCGLPAAATLMVGISFSVLAAFVAAIWGYLAVKQNKPPRWKQKLGAIALGPVWFCILAYAIGTGYSLALHGRT